MEQPIYIAEWNNHRIIECRYGTTSGTVVAGGNEAGNGTFQLHSPYDVIVDRERDSLIVCDNGNKRVVRWPRRNDGDVANGKTIISDIDCIGLTMDANGFLYVVENGKHEVRRYSMDGGAGKVVAGGHGRGDGLHQLASPYYVFVDRDHSVYMSDAKNNRVMKWEEGAKEGTVVAGANGEGSSLTQLHWPRGVVVDQLGTVYVADLQNHRIMRWTKGSTQGSVIAGGNDIGEQLNQLNYPIGLSFDRYGNLYVADEYNHRVQKFEIE